MSTPAPPPPFHKRDLRPHQTVADCEVELLTRQFGGGHAAREVDPATWLRPSAVRGALRFWWRAQFGSSDWAETRRREEALFGLGIKRDEHGQIVEGPGCIALTVQTTVTKATAPLQLQQGDPLSVAYFPASDMGQAGASLLQPGARAQIRITTSDTASADEVRQALVAFVTLGGAGARTRRTAGAIGFVSEAAARAVGAPWSADQVRTHLGMLTAQGSTGQSYFAVAGSSAWLSPPKSSADAAQRLLLEVWREFRQDRSHPANWRGASGWGRTRWPEADAQRFVRNAHARWADGTSHAPLETNRGKAPRAHLGLPMGLKFKDDNRGARHPVRGELLMADPGKSELIPFDSKLERYASPVLLSVARVAEGYVGIVLVTPSRLNQDFQVKFKDTQAALAVGPWSEVVQRLETKLNEFKFQRIQASRR